MSNQSQRLPQGLIEAFAGFVAGIASVRLCHQVQMLDLTCQTLVAHPLDMIKTRLQGKHKRLSSAPYGFGEVTLLASRPRVSFTTWGLVAVGTNNCSQ